MTRRWQNDPAFEKQVHQFYEAVAIGDRTTRDAEIRRLLASFKKQRLQPAARKKAAPGTKKKKVVTGGNADSSFPLA